MTHRPPDDTPDCLVPGDVVEASIRQHYVRWIVRSVDGKTVVASAPGRGSVRFQWFAPEHRWGEGHGHKFYFVRHAKTPTSGSTWRHRNGNLYRVLFLTNVVTFRPDHPPDVVYESTTHDALWSRPLADWHRSFTEETP